jgi:TolA-binding protein
MRYGEPRWYHSKRASLQRLIIPGALAALVAGAAIGAAASYLGSPPSTAEHARRATDTAAPVPAPVPSAPATTGGRSSTPSRGGSTTTPTAGGVASGKDLNDRAYALIQHTEYAAAIPILRRAVVDLRGTGPADPYEAYANYNLGYALLQSGQCAAALPPLGVAKRLETSPLVGVAIRRARACAPPGS